MRRAVLALLVACAAEDPDACDWGTEQGLTLGAECLPGEVVVVCQTERGEAWATECEACALDAYLVAQEECP